jgi:hypothetical protein
LQAFSISIVAFDLALALVEMIALWIRATRIHASLENAHAKRKELEQIPCLVS